MNAGICNRFSALKNLGNTMQKQFMINMVMILMCCLTGIQGIPLSVVTAIAFSELYGKEIRYCSDRKEEKDHGADKGKFSWKQTEGRRSGSYDRRRYYIRKIYGRDSAEGKRCSQCRKLLDRWFHLTAWRLEKAV